MKFFAALTAIAILTVAVVAIPAALEGRECVGINNCEGNPHGIDK